MILKNKLFLLSLICTFLISLCVQSQAQQIQESRSNANHTKLDSCHSKPVIPIIKSDNEIFTGGTISLNAFQSLQQVAFFSTCHKREIEVTGFRLVGATDHKGPIVIQVSGNIIQSEHLKKLKSLGSHFKLFIEDIQAADNQVALQNMQLRVQ